MGNQIPSHVLIFNTSYVDASIESLYSVLPLTTIDGESWIGFFLPRDYEKLQIFLANQPIKSLSLIGSFRDLSAHLKTTNTFLENLFSNATVPRIWIMFFDLHHEPIDLIYGKKTPLDNRYRRQFRFERYFDILAWGYEDFDSQLHKKFANSLSPIKNPELYRSEIADNTGTVLRASFANRIHFPHCINPTLIERTRVLMFLPKIWKLSIPGANYETRRRISRIANQEEIRLSPKNLFFKASGFLVKYLERIASFLGYSGATFKPIKRTIMYHKMMLEASFSKYTWLDGSELEYPVRKFFEIPFSGSMPIIAPTPCLNNLNLFDSRQVIDDPEKLSHTLSILDSLSLVERFRLKLHSQKVLLDMHTPECRFRQLSQYLNCFDDKSRQVGKFRDGKFFIERY